MSAQKPSFWDPESAQWSDNVSILIRDQRCLISTVAPPFRTAYWPDLGALLSELGFACSALPFAQNGREKEQFLSMLAEHLPQGKAFKPRTIGFRTGVADYPILESYRANNLTLVCIGACDRETTLGALEILVQPLRPNALVQVQFKGWDPLEDWASSQNMLNDVLHWLCYQKPCNAAVTCFSRFQTIPDQLWEYFYDRPRARLGWIAESLARCADLIQLEHWRQNDRAWQSLKQLGQDGLWPHIVLPATRDNTQLLVEITAALHQETRGATVEIVPAPFLVLEKEYPPPGARELEAALMAIYTRTPIPLRQAVPFSWVLDRVNAENALVSSPLAAGAEVAVLANGEMYAGESSIGLEAWHLGQVSGGRETLQWERLDALPETLSYGSKPPQCQTCDWRYRCGGVDGSVQMLGERARSAGNQEQKAWFDLYCRPRKALFEEMLWNSVEMAVQDQAKPQPESIELNEDSILYQPKAIAEVILRDNDKCLMTNDDKPKAIEEVDKS